MQLVPPKNIALYANIETRLYEAMDLITIDFIQNDKRLGCGRS